MADVGGPGPDGEDEGAVIHAGRQVAQGRGERPACHRRRILAQAVPVGLGHVGEALGGQKRLQGRKPRGSPVEGRVGRAIRNPAEARRGSGVEDGGVARAFLKPAVGGGVSGVHDTDHQGAQIGQGIGW